MFKPRLGVAGILLLTSMSGLASCQCETLEGGTPSADATTENPDGGAVAALQWPSTSVDLPGAAAPAIARTASNKVVLAFARDSKVWSLANPTPGAVPVELGAPIAAIDFHPQIRLAADPTSERIMVLWNNGSFIQTLAGIPDGTQGQLTQAPMIYNATHFDLRWSGGRPVGTVLSSSDNRLRHYAFDLGDGDLLPLPTTLPTAATLADDGLRAWYYDMAPTLIGLSGGRALLFFNASDDGRVARYLRLERDPSVATGDPAWLVPQSSGTLTLPPGASTSVDWVQIHPLDQTGSRAALTWAEVAPMSQVFDVHLALLDLSADGTPSLSAAAAVNVSNTGGQTDNSDMPIVKPAGDGRIWVAWREANGGPRVALYDNALHRLGIAAPPTELRVRTDSALAAEVDGVGTLHLAAVVQPGNEPEVRYWVLARP
ncbi:MAG: hypothetical protein HY901_34845 [Deltaproteobacteria bacterium]|nr:hypothetical protein [Deltaproteobacteria bacterium]